MKKVFWNLGKREEIIESFLLITSGKKWSNGVRFVFRLISRKLFARRQENHLMETNFFNFMIVYKI